MLTVETIVYGISETVCVTARAAGWGVSTRGTPNANPEGVDAEKPQNRVYPLPKIDCLLHFGTIHSLPSASNLLRVIVFTDFLSSV